jgi:hypothetical protein
MINRIELTLFVSIGRRHELMQSREIPAEAAKVTRSDRDQRKTINTRELPLMAGNFLIAGLSDSNRSSQ